MKQGEESEVPEVTYKVRVTRNNNTEKKKKEKKTNEKIEKIAELNN